MKIRDFKLEVYFGKYEFTAPYLLTQSDCEAMKVSDLLEYEPDAEKKLLDSWLGYTEVTGPLKLRSLASNLYSSIKEDEILMHAGAQEAIFDFMNVVLENGDHVISMYPIYQSLYEIAFSLGCEVGKWELRPTESGNWELDFDELEKLIQPNTKVIAINTPNNPTGYTLTEEEIQKLCDIAEKHGIYIFADEVYRGIDLDGQKRPWVADVYDKAVSLGVLSKAYGFAGLRIGWVATKDKDLLDKMTKFKHYLSICNSSTSEVLAEVVFKHGKKFLQRNTQIVQENLKIANAFFERYTQLFTNYKPQCGPVAFHKMNLKDKTIEDFCEELVQKSGVLLLPAPIYEYEGSYFRMGYGRKSFADSLSRFEKYLIEEKYV